MKTASIDLLEKAELPPHQAHASLKAVELEITSAHEHLAAKTDLLGIKADLLTFKAELKDEINALRVEMHAFEGRLARWVLTCMLGQTAVLAGFGYFALTHLVR